MKIIAEFGANWNSYSDVIQMMDKCDQLEIKFVKFQLWRRDQAPQEVQQCYIDKERAKKFFEAGKNRGLEVFFSVMYPEAVDICEELGVNYYKIRYNDRYDVNIAKKILQTGKPYFVSLDHSNLYHFLHEIENRWPLLCVPKYPATFEDYHNIVTFGYSDHTPDLKLYEYAKFGGAVWFEMHVCLDKNCYEAGWSKTFQELKEVLD